jgi:murein DD-endopeptidase MepM/ murein hydrolase activator NlpD
MLKMQLTKQQQQKSEVDKLVKQEAAALKVAEDDKAEVQAQYNELRAEQIRIAALSKSAGSQGPVDPQATGPLSWPLPGRAAGGGVGWRVHPVYKYKSCHTGVDSGAPKGTPIRAAASGVVLSTTVSRAYGNMTLIDHGGGMVTMYAHQSQFGVVTRPSCWKPRCDWLHRIHWLLNRTTFAL